VTLETRTWRTIGERSLLNGTHSREGDEKWHMLVSLTRNNQGGNDVLTEFAKDRSTGSTMLPRAWHRASAGARDSPRSDRVVEEKGR
jgi:hypothetical protein